MDIYLVGFRILAIKHQSSTNYLDRRDLITEKTFPEIPQLDNLCNLPLMSLLDKDFKVDDRRAESIIKGFNDPIYIMPVRTPVVDLEEQDVYFCSTVCLS